MVIQRTVDKLRERPEHERAAVAASVAIGVVLLLLVGWVIVFLHGISSGSGFTELEQPAAPAPVAASSSNSVPETVPASSLEGENSTDTVQVSSSSAY